MITDMTAWAVWAGKAGGIGMSRWRNADWVRDDVEAGAKTISCQCGITGLKLSPKLLYVKCPKCRREYRLVIKVEVREPEREQG